MENKEPVMVNRKRPETLSEKRPALDAMGRCRHAMIVVCGKVKIGSPTYFAAHAVTKAIDAMAGLLTGDPTYYHEGGVTPGSDQTKWRDQGW